MSSREKIPPNIDFVIMPSDRRGAYASHVRHRMSLFVNVTLRVWHYLSWVRQYNPPQGPSPFPLMGACFSPHADVQAGTGFRNPQIAYGKLDAAHLMNTSVKQDILTQGIQHVPGYTQDQWDALNELREVSAATTTQRQADNVGPDKVIDGCMTALIAQCAAACDNGQAPPDAGTLMNLLCDLCRDTIGDQRVYEGYAVALDGIEAARSDAYDVERDVQAWLAHYRFTTPPAATS